MRLPPGFTSRIVAQSGVAPVGGEPVWHSAPDGGACFPTADGGWIYVSNSEIGSGGGGVRALRFDAAANVVGCTVICSGTSRNCAGGKMPWGVWLTCEENGETSLVFECDPLGVATVVGGGPEGSVTWLPVPDPDGSPIATRYQVGAMTAFNGGEGVVARNGVVHFATKGDNRIWSYDVATQQL